MSKQSRNIAIYQIQLGCHIEKHQQYWFDDLMVSNLDNGECTLVGSIPDQAALFGILLKIRDLGLPLISVNRIQPE
jgi:hypothetical protein